MKDYFSHDYYARNDKELVKVLMNHKLEGIGLFWCIIEMLYEEGGYLLLSEYERISFELRTTNELIDSLINNFDLFKKDDKKFWSESVIERLNLRAEKSEKARKSIEKRWEKYERNTNVKETNVKRNTNKVKESKVKESKVNKNIIPEFIEFKTYVLTVEPNINLKSLEYKYKSWIENDWKDGNNKKIVNWKSKILNTLQYIEKNNNFKSKSHITHDTDY